MPAVPQNELLPLAPERLRSLGYSAEALKQLLGIAFPDDVGPLNRAAAIERLRQNVEPAGVLARLFYLEDALEPRLLRRVFSVRELEALQRARLIAHRDGLIRARLRMDVVEGVYLLADRRFHRPDERAGGLAPGDMVYPPGSDSAILAQAIPETSRGETLDLCTGSGVQGIVLASRENPVTAVDIGARASALAKLNAQLNGVRDFTVKHGDLYRAVPHRRYDVVVANPPFVPAPKRGPAYHSGGPRGDRVLRRIARGLGEHLRPQGRAFMISHLALRRGESVEQALSPAFRHFPGRVLALQLEVGSPIDLASAQSLFALDRGFAAYGREVRSWVEYLRGHGIDRIVLLLIVAERTEKPAFEVREAFQRVLPLPLSRPPRDLITEWLGG